MKKLTYSKTNQHREQFINDMVLAGLAPEAQRVYLDAIDSVVRHYWQDPAMLTEQQVQDYIIERLKNDLPKGTYKVIRYALRFFFINTLGRDWTLFKKK